MSNQETVGLVLRLAVSVAISYITWRAIQEIINPNRKKQKEAEQQVSLACFVSLDWLIGALRSLSLVCTVDWLIGPTGGYFITFDRIQFEPVRLVVFFFLEQRVIQTSRNFGGREADRTWDVCGDKFSGARHRVLLLVGHWRAGWYDRWIAEDCSDAAAEKIWCQGVSACPSAKRCVWFKAVELCPWVIPSIDWLIDWLIDQY